MTEKTGTFLVTHADDDSAVLRDVTSGQVHALSENPDLVEREVLTATVAPEPPMEVTWELLEVASRRTIELVETDLEPTRQARQAAADAPEGEVTTIERAGNGEVHVLAVPDADAAASEILADEATLERAARLDSVRVEVRRGEGMVSVRYLPD